MKKQSSFEDLVSEVSKRTDMNHHTKALIVISSYFDLTEETENLENIEKEHMSRGHISYSEVQYRSSIGNKIFDFLKDEIGDAEYSKLISAL